MYTYIPHAHIHYTHSHTYHTQTHIHHTPHAHTRTYTPCTHIPCTHTYHTTYKSPVTIFNLITYFHLGLLQARGTSSALSVDTQETQTHLIETVMVATAASMIRPLRPSPKLKCVCLLETRPASEPHRVGSGGRAGGGLQGATAAPASPVGYSYREPSLGVGVRPVKARGTKYLKESSGPHLGSREPSYGREGREPGRMEEAGRGAARPAPAALARGRAPSGRF